MFRLPTNFFPSSQFYFHCFLSSSGATASQAYPSATRSLQLFTATRPVSSFQILSSFRFLFSFPPLSLSFYPFAAILPLVFSTRKLALFLHSFLQRTRSRSLSSFSVTFLNAFVKEQNAYTFSFSTGRSAASRMPVYFPENSIVPDENALFSRLIGQRCFSRGAIRPGLVQRM